MTSALFLLRAKQIGLTLSEMDMLTYGQVSDLMTEQIHDTLDWPKRAGQAQFNSFLGGTYGEEEQQQS